MDQGIAVVIKDSLSADTNTLTCPKCGTSGHSALFGTQRVNPISGRVDHCGPQWCRGCIRAAGFKTPGQLLAELNQKRASSADGASK